MMDRNSLIYLYDLPKEIYTTAKIASKIKEKSGYDLVEPA
jgi:hypothetical protein